MESMLQLFRKNSLRHLQEDDLTQARISISAIIGMLAIDERELQFVRQTFPKIAEADAVALRMILRVAYDRAIRSENQRRNEKNDHRQGSFISWMR